MCFKFRICIFNWGASQYFFFIFLSIFCYWIWNKRIFEGCSQFPKRRNSKNDIQSWKQINLYNYIKKLIKLFNISSKEIYLTFPWWGIVNLQRSSVWLLRFYDQWTDQSKHLQKWQSWSIPRASLPMPWVW